MGGIFISYRRDDSRHAAGRLVDRLAQVFPREQLFMDIDAIEPGLDFFKVINAKLAECDVLLAVIGPSWANARGADGALRLDDPNDLVRLELEVALERDIRVIPVLVDGAQLPRVDGLPEGLKPLVRRNAVRLAHERFGAEADSLAASLAPLITRPAPVDRTTLGQVRAESDIGKAPADALANERSRLAARLRTAGACFIGVATLTIAVGMVLPPLPSVLMLVVSLILSLLFWVSLLSTIFYSVKLFRLKLKR